MDSKLIFIKSKRLLSKIMWRPTPNFGWQYCGQSDELDIASLQQTIDRHFATNLVYFVTNRDESRLVAKSEVVDLVARYIDRVEITCWDEGFATVLQFNTIGVFRVGDLYM